MGVVREMFARTSRDIIMGNTDIAIGGVELRRFLERLLESY